MEITAYMNLTPKNLIFDPVTRGTALAPDARNPRHVVHPDLESAASALIGGQATYTVTADVPDGSIFEVRGEFDQTEGHLGTYIAGLFSNYAAAFEAADGLGLHCRRGEITVRPELLEVFDSAADWSARRSPARYSGTSGTDLRMLVNLRAGDTAAQEVADEYALFLKLSEKYAPQNGAAS